MIREVWKNHGLSPQWQCAGAHHNNCVAILGEKRVPVFSHPVYSPDLSPGTERRPVRYYFEGLEVCDGKTEDDTYSWVGET